MNSFSFLTKFYRFDKIQGLKDRGKMAEWSKAGALKASGGQLPGGSNPSLSDRAPEKELFLLPKGLTWEKIYCIYLQQN